MPLPYRITPTQSGKASANGLEIYYETFGKAENPAVLLTMGLDAQCTLWSGGFIQPLVDAGYYVIRYDNRDIGLSTWVEDWKRYKPYTLEDMAKDSIGLLDFLKIDKTHLIGVSMGGMISQRLAISYPKRVLSLTSIMSSGYTLQVANQTSIYDKIRALIGPVLLKYVDIKTKYTHFEVNVKNYVTIWRTLVGSRFQFNYDYFKELFTHNIEERKGQNPNAKIQQFSAIAASGSRLKEMKNIKAPTLVFHGTEDHLVPPIHAKTYQPLIPNSKMVWLEGVGHEVPKGIVETIHKEVLSLYEKVSLSQTNPNLETV